MIPGALCPCGARATVRINAGARCERCRPREYGPHDEREQAATVKITLGSYERGKHHREHGPFRELVVPVPESAKRFRATINTMAHDAGRVLERFTDG